METHTELDGYEIALSEDGRIVVCRVHEPVTVALAASFSQALEAASEASGVDRFLTDVRGVPNVSRLAENYNYAHTDMAELGLRRVVRAAVLADPWDRSHEFVETVSQNAGYNVRVFYDRDEAVTWLLAPA